MQYVVSNVRHVVNEQRRAGMSRQRGATLIEIILYLAVAAIIIFAIFSLFGNAFGGGKSQSESANIQGLVSGVNSIYGTQRTYPTGSLIPALITTKAAPSAMIVQGGATDSLRNSWGAGVTVVGFESYYQIKDTGVPARACIELAQMSLGAVGFGINGAGMNSPASALDATNACKAENNTLSWDVK